MNNQKRAEVLRQAWIGDAVLALYARRWILAEMGETNGDCFARMTSNQFLSCAGNADEVEAQIGRLYEADGQEAAFQWIEATLMPTFVRQEAKRRKKLGKAKVP